MIGAGEKLVDLLTKGMSSTASTADEQEQEDVNCAVDLLETKNGSTMFVYAKDRGNKQLNLQSTDQTNGPWCTVKSAAEVMALHRRGCKARAVGRTDLNEHSSRSHSILMMMVESEGVNGTTCGTLTMVDLAGSEVSSLVCVGICVSVFTSHFKCMFGLTTHTYSFFFSSSFRLLVFQECQTIQCRWK